MRVAGVRSTTVGLNPYRRSQYASVGPATLAPEIRTSLLVGFIEASSEALQRTRTHLPCTGLHRDPCCPRQSIGRDAPVGPPGLEELTASRARIVAAADTERRRIERDLHDGVQQRVVALLTRLRLAGNELNRGGRPPATVLDDVAVDARELLTDLRELAHGIHPPVLTDRGVVAAVEARADRLPLPVTVHADA